MRGSRRLSRATASLLVAFLLGACLGEGPDGVALDDPPIGRPTLSEGLVIALVGTLSGPDAWRGEDAFEGADLAVHELNQSRREGDLLFELVALDDGGDVAEATRRVQEIARLDRAVGVVYAGPPEGLPAAEEALAEAGIPAVLVHGDLYGARALTPHVFQASPSFVWGARRLAAYFLRDRRYRRIGMLAATGSQGDVAVAALRAALDPRRPAVARYADAEDVADALRRLKRRRVEAVVVQGDSPSFVAALASLRQMGAAYRTSAQARIASAPRRLRVRRVRRDHWRPQVAGFDQAIATAVADSAYAGTIGVDTYARGVHLLPVPNFDAFDRSFRGWWGAPPLGWEQRAYDAARAIAWAVRRADPDEDLARALEHLSGRRFAGGEIVLGPDDHTLVDQGAVGLWTIPREGVARSHRLPENLPWLPLARGFAIDGRRTDIPPADWEHLFRGPPPPNAPPPPARRMRFAVATPRNDPVH